MEYIYLDNHSGRAVVVHWKMLLQVISAAGSCPVTLPRWDLLTIFVWMLEKQLDALGMRLGDDLYRNGQQTPSTYQEHVKLVQWSSSHFWPRITHVISPSHLSVVRTAVGPYIFWYHSNGSCNCLSKTDKIAEDRDHPWHLSWVPPLCGWIILYPGRFSICPFSWPYTYAAGLALVILLYFFA